jgi:hypothetical protein
VLAVGLLVTAQLLGGHVLSNYFVDIAAAVTVIILSVLTYEERERGLERGRYEPSEEVGIVRIKAEVSQLLYQYAFVLNLRGDSESEAMQTL